MTIRRVCIIVLDSLGVGALPDAAAFGDVGCDTLRRIAASSQFDATNMRRLGLGNIDGTDVRFRFKEVARFKVEDCNVLMKHIGGYPGRYDISIRKAIYTEKPQLFIAGHSHILKVEYDKLIDCLHINPGAAGKQGWQQVRTLVKFTIDGNKIKDLEVIELA